MNKSEIAQIRLYNQQIATTNFSKPAEIVSWLGAMQAQDYPMAKWAIGVRLPDSTEQKIEKAIEAGEIVRTHLMRPTWHFVAAEDIRWMLTLTAPRVKSTSASMFRQFELDEKTCRQTNEIIAKALVDGKHLTRQELMFELEKVGIKTNDYRAGVIMLNAELDAVVCSGIKRGKLQTYALLEERVPKNKILSRDEAIAELTKRYFTSHAPATLKDFVWWSGLSVADARKGLEINKSNLVNFEIEGEVFWMFDSIPFPKIETDSLYLLPAFDEFTVSYKDRTAVLESGFAKSAITGNGIFKPIIVAGGKVVGVWKRSFKKDSVIVEKILFSDLDESEKEAFNRQAKKYSDFEGKILKQI
jgi:Winged helix DNA-binding domain